MHKVIASFYYQPYVFSLSNKTGGRNIVLIEVSFAHVCLQVVSLSVLESSKISNNV